MSPKTEEAIKQIALELAHIRRILEAMRNQKAEEITARKLTIKDFS